MQANDVGAPRLIDTLLANAKYKRYITTASGGFWMVCDRPFGDAAVDIWRDAIRVSNAVPSVLSRTT